MKEQVPLFQIHPVTVPSRPKKSKPKKTKEKKMETNNNWFPWPMLFGAEYTVWASKCMVARNRQSLTSDTHCVSRITRARLTSITGRGLTCPSFTGWEFAFLAPHSRCSGGWWRYSCLVTHVGHLHERAGHDSWPEAWNETLQFSPSSSPPLINHPLTVELLVSPKPAQTKV